MPVIPTIVSVDDHVIEPPTCGPTGCRRSTSTSGHGSSTPIKKITFVGGVLA